jgi:hypothetical protein
MSPYFAFVAAAVAAQLLGACATSRPVRTPSPGGAPLSCEDARAWQDALRTLDTTTLLTVEPTTWVDTCSGAAQVTGTRVRIRGSEASSNRLSGRLASLLECPNARVRVEPADTSQPGSDRLWLRAGWVDIDVKREAGNYSVRLSAESVSKNLQLLRAATAYAHAQHPSEVLRAP